MGIPGAQESVQLSRLLNAIPSLCENAVNSGLKLEASQEPAISLHGNRLTPISFRILTEEVADEYEAALPPQVWQSIFMTPCSLFSEEREERLREKKYHHAIGGRKGGPICLQIFPHHYSSSHS